MKARQQHQQAREEEEGGLGKEEEEGNTIESEERSTEEKKTMVDEFAKEESASEEQQAVSDDCILKKRELEGEKSKLLNFGEGGDKGDGEGGVREKGGRWVNYSVQQPFFFLSSLSEPVYPSPLRRSVRIRNRSVFSPMCSPVLPTRKSRATPQKAPPTQVPTGLLITFD